MNVEDILNLLSSEDKKKPVFVQGDCVSFIVSGIDVREDSIYLDVEEFN